MNSFGQEVATEQWFESTVSHHPNAVNAQADAPVMTAASPCQELESRSSAPATALPNMVTIIPKKGIYGLSNASPILPN